MPLYASKDPVVQQYPLFDPSNTDPIYFPVNAIKIIDRQTGPIIHFDALCSVVQIQYNQLALALSKEYHLLPSRLVSYLIKKVGIAPDRIQEANETESVPIEWLPDVLRYYVQVKKRFYGNASLLLSAIDHYGLGPVLGAIAAFHDAQSLRGASQGFSPLCQASIPLYLDEAADACCRRIQWQLALLQDLEPRHQEQINTLSHALAAIENLQEAQLFQG